MNTLKNIINNEKVQTALFFVFANAVLFTLFVAIPYIIK